MTAVRKLRTQPSPPKKRSAFPSAFPIAFPIAFPAMAYYFVVSLPKLSEQQLDRVKEWGKKLTECFLVGTARDTETGLEPAFDLYGCTCLTRVLAQQRWVLGILARVRLR